MTGASASASRTLLTRALRESDALAGPQALHDLDVLVVREPERHAARNRLAGRVDDRDDRVVLLVARDGFERDLHDVPPLGDDDADADVHAGLQAGGMPFE